MKGVQYFFDNKGNPKAVLIDLKKNPEIWEDFQDVMVARKRRHEPTVSAQEVEKYLRNRQGKRK